MSASASPALLILHPAAEQATVRDLCAALGPGVSYHYEEEIALLPRHRRTYAAILLSAADAAVLPVLQQYFAGIPRIIFTREFSASEAWRCRGLGATHYLPVPSLARQLRILLDGAPASDRHKPVFTSKRMLELVDSAKKIAALDVSVLLLGESGTGKEVLADLIHRHSARRDAPFVKVNCAALPRELIESELFGSIKGSYTGSTGDKRGLFRRAHGGTLLLDELAEMPVDVQAKLLRVLQDQEVRPVGGEDSIKVDVRLIAATNQEPRSAIAAGRLRADLYYRVALGVFTLPPLRQRREEIPALVAHFLATESSRLGLGAAPALAPAALAALQAHDWPGNIRQLQGVLIRALVQSARSGELRPEHLEFDLLPRDAGSDEREISNALAAAGGNRDKAAALLGLSPRTFYRRMKAPGREI